jgi:hypothetical protein
MPEVFPMTRHRPSALLPALPLLALLGGCFPQGEIALRPQDFNPALRPDREALDSGQLAADVARLRFGPYRPLSTDLAQGLMPAEQPGLANLPQSDCWWMGHGATGTDAMRAAWEAVALVDGSVGIGKDYVDPEDGKLDIGLCRLNDPQTREPPRHRSSGNSAFADVDCAQLGGGGGGVGLRGGAAENLIRCTSDVALFAVQLHAYRNPAPADPRARCPARSAFSVRDRTLVRGVDFYSGGSIVDAGTGYVSACSQPSGEVLIPSIDTRYALTYGNNIEHWLEPVVLPAGDGRRLARAMGAVAGAVWRWATPVTTEPAGGQVRWEENFSATLRVGQVRAYRFDAAGNPVEIAGAPPRLCIEDPQSGGGCRWTCADSNAGDARLHYDLQAAGACTDASGRSELPLVTPTYAFATRDAVELEAPLGWSASLPGVSAPWIEFTLKATFTDAALTAQPAVTDLGGTRRLERTRASFRVRNAGGHPLRVLQVQKVLGYGQPVDFTIELPDQPAPVPLPVEVLAGKDTQTVRLTPDAESQQTLTLFQDLLHLRVAPRRGGFAFVRDGIAVTERNGLLLRDQAGAQFRFDAPTPGARLAAARTTYVLRTPPFALQPGQDFEVSVVGRPSAFGQREARVRIVAESMLDPARRVEIQPLVRVFGQQGPLLSVLPLSLAIGAQGAGQMHQRNVLMVNDGDSAASVGAPVLRAAGGTMLPAGSPFSLTDPYGAGSLAAGASRHATVRLLSSCAGAAGGWRDDFAELHWGTPDGTRIVPFHAATACGP